MSANVMEARSRLAEQDIAQNQRDRSVSISSMTNLIAALALASAAVAAYVAIDIGQDVKVQQIYITKLHADLIANGFEPPKLPEEEE